MNVKHFSFANKSSGAFNAAYRIHSCLKNKVNTSMCVVKNSYNDGNSIFKTNSIHKFIIYFKIYIIVIFKKITKTKKFNPFSLSILPSFFSSHFNKSEKDTLIHLHWINFEMISIYEIGKIKTPIVWTIHDLWPISGIFHLEQKSSKNIIILLLDKLVKNLKKVFWKKKYFYLVAPSTWMLEKILENTIITNYKVCIIPNPIDLNFWKQEKKIQVNKKIIIGFGAYNFLADQNKGYDLFIESLKILKYNNFNIQFKIVTFGDKFPQEIEEMGFEVYSFGENLTEFEIRNFYNSIDLLVVPSRIESFGQVATEAMACGCPVIGFNNSGLTDIVEHKKTGYLATPFNPDDLTNGILWFYQNHQQKYEVSKMCIKRVKENFSYEVVSQKYIDLYNEIIQIHQ